MTRKPTAPHTAQSLEDPIADALCAQGWLMPQTDKDVMRTAIDSAHNPIALAPELVDSPDLMRTLCPGTPDTTPESSHVEKHQRQSEETVAAQPQSPHVSVHMCRLRGPA